MGYSAADIEAALRCVQETNPDSLFSPAGMRGFLFYHLEGHCDCLAGRCPACDERERNGEEIHLITCPLLETAYYA